MASRSSRQYRLYVGSRGDGIIWVREHRDDLDPALDGLGPYTLARALEVHERFGGGVFEEVGEKGSCDVVDRPGWQGQWTKAA